MELFLLILFFAVTLLVLTAFDRIFALPFLHSSNREVRDLLIGLEDLLLPMGSFASIDDGQYFGPGDYPDEIFFDSLEYLQASNDNTHIGEPGVGIPLPEQDEAETNLSSSASTFVGEGEEQRLEEEPQEEDSTAAMEEVSTETQSFEKAICELVDPEEKYGRDLQKIIELVAGTIERQTEAEDCLRCETTRFQRALEDQANEWMDMRGVFDCIIIGQHAKLRLTQEYNGDLREENDKLITERDGLKTKNDSMKIQSNTKLRSLNVKKETAEKAAERAEADVEGRIDELKKRYNKETSDAEKKNTWEKNTIICSKRMVEDSLRNARSQAILSQQQYDTEIWNKDSIINQLNTDVRQLKLAATVPERLAAFAEKRLQKQLNDQRKAKDEEIDTLKVQLRKSEYEIKALGGWEKKAKAEERNNQRALDRFNEETTTLREKNERMVSEFKRNMKGLERTIGTNSLTIAELERKATSLESGQEVKDLRSQLTKARKQSRKLTNESESLNKQLQSLGLKTADLEKTIEDRNCEVEHNKKAWATEKGNLEHDIQQLKAGSQRHIEEAIKQLKEEKQGVCTKVQSLEEEKVRTAEHHQNALNGKDQEIRGLEKAIVDSNSQLQHRIEVEGARRLKKAVEAKEMEVWKEAIQLCGERNSELAENTGEAKQRFRAHLENEVRTALEKMNEAAKTENDLRTEIGALKSQIEGYANAAEPMSIVKANSEPVLNKKESDSLDREMEEANNLFDEIEEQGLHRICGERLMLKELNKAKKTLASVKYEIQQPEPDKNDILFAISEATIDEGRFQQCDSRKRPVLLRQARAANGRLQSLQRMLSTDSEVQRDAVLAILQSPEMSETMASPSEARAHDTFIEGATAQARQGQGELVMSEGSETQRTIISEVSQSGEPPRSLTDILATLQSLPPAAPSPSALQSHGPQQQTGANGPSIAPPNQEEKMTQPPLPGLFQSQGIDQAPPQGSFPPQSVRNFRRPVISQPKGEIKMPRGFTARTRQWAKGWVRNGDIERAETLLLQNFQLLQKIGATGLRSYLGELKRQVESQSLDQMEQPGGWTDQMTRIVEDGLNDGHDPETIVKSVNMDSSRPTDMPEMEGVELYVKKLEREYNSKPAPKPAGWTDEMTGTVMHELQANSNTEFELIEELLMVMNGFEIKNKKGLHRYLERLKREFQQLVDIQQGGSGGPSPAGASL